MCASRSATTSPPASPSSESCRERPNPPSSHSVIRQPGRGPRRRRWQALRDKRRRGIFLLPSLLTTGNLFCGFFALLLTVDARYKEAALAIFVAMIMDLLDGRVA